MMLESFCVGWKSWKPLSLHTHDVDRQWFTLNSQNKHGWTYFKNCIFVRHYSCRHRENKICQTSLPFSPSRLPLRAHFHRERDVWVPGRPVSDAILTSRQTREKLQYLYENLMSNNFVERLFWKRKKKNCKLKLHS